MGCCSSRETCNPYGTKRHHDEIMVAICNFQSVDENDLTINQNDRLLVIDKSRKDWIKVENVETKQQGFVPSNFVAAENSLFAKPWFFGEMSRWETQVQLLNNEFKQPVGTYLIRLTDQIPNGYCLSVKCHTENSVYNDYEVRHYRIEVDPVSFQYHGLGHIFRSLDDLINTNCHWLTEPCIKPKPPLHTISSRSEEVWEISRRRIKLVKQLGKGNSGFVYFGFCDDTIPIAVKELKDVSDAEEFYSEAFNMRQLRHDKLVQLYGVCSVAKPFYLVQEYMNKGDLLTVLRKDLGQTLDNLALVSIARQVAEGMEYLESKKLIHRDLAARNIMISEDNQAKIGDFGLSRFLTSEEYISAKSKVAYKWTDPLAFQTQKFTIKSDVWSYGILLMEVFSYGMRPYMELSAYIDRDVLTSRLLAGYRMIQPSCVPNDVYEIALKCWSGDPENRPSFSELRAMLSKQISSSYEENKITFNSFS